MTNLALKSGGSPLTVVCLGSHSDDVEIGCGGTLLKLIAGGSQVRVGWIVFSGSDQRADEARASASRFLEGAAEQHVEIKGFRDGFFPYVGYEVKQSFEELKQRWSPDVIFTHYREDRHQDHRLISDLTWNTFRDHLILEYEILKYDGDLASPNVFVPLRLDHVEKKVQTLLDAFASQRAKQWFTADAFKAVLRLRGIESNAASGFAEGFHCPKLRWLG